MFLSSMVAASRLCACFEIEHPKHGHKREAATDRKGVQKATRSGFLEEGEGPRQAGHSVTAPRVVGICCGLSKPSLMCESVNNSPTDVSLFPT